MTDDLIARLKGHSEIMERDKGKLVRFIDVATCTEAADRIEELATEAAENARIIGMSAEREMALRGEIERLREALQFYADRPCNMEFGVVNECPYDDGDIARAALNGGNHD